MNSKTAIKNVFDVPSKFDKSGGTISGPTTGTRITSSEWFYSTGSTGWYNEAFNGGWHMNDANWLRSYADKGIVTGGTVQGGNVTVSGNNVYHTGRKPSAADVGARASNWVPSWGDVTGKPSTFSPSSHSHNYIPTSASCNKSWNWSGQGGQPTWLWGGNEPSNMYLYNPSNFSVNYANTANTCNRSSASNWSDDGANATKIKWKNIWCQQAQPNPENVGDVWISW